MNKLVIHFLLIIACSYSTNVYAAQVYKWIDDNGQVHYGSKPPTKNAKKMNIKDRYIDSGTANRPASAQQRAEEQRRFVDALTAEEEALKAEKQKQDEKENLRFQRCIAARDQLKNMQEAGALYDLDDKGNRVILNNQQHQQAMKLARKRVSQWCD